MMDMPWLRPERGSKGEVCLGFGKSIEIVQGTEGAFGLLGYLETFVIKQPFQITVDWTRDYIQ